MPNNLIATVRADANRYLASGIKGRSLASYFRLVFLAPGFQLALSIRLQSVCTRIPVVGIFLRRVLWYFTTIWFGCDIDPHASFGPGIYFPHPIGIVIGGEWDIGDNVSILHGVTLGRNHEEPSRRSRVSDSVVITAGAKLIGSIEIGTGATIGANAVVLTDVPEHHIAVGVPARMLKNRAKANAESI